MHLFVWGMDVDLCSVQGVLALLELRSQFPEVWSNYNFGVDVNKCMTKVFVGTTLGLLYKLENDNCHFHDKIRFAKELFNLLSIGIVKRKQWATFLFVVLANIVVLQGGFI